MRRPLLNLRGVVRTSPIAINGRSYQNLESFAPAAEWEELSCATVSEIPEQGNADDLRSFERALGAWGFAKGHTAAASAMFGTRIQQHLNRCGISLRDLVWQTDDGG
jgi:hypothetical protein